MREIMQALLRDNVITVTDYPQLATEAAQEELAELARKVGADISYDAVGRTMALIVPGVNDSFTPLERASILIAWGYLEYRKEEYRSQPQRDRLSVLTEEKAAELRAHKAYTLRPEQLSADFPNLYPKTNVASGALNSLVQRKILEPSERRIGERVERVFIAGPLLRHVVKAEEARALIEGELRGHFEHLKPGDPDGDNLRAKLLYQLRALAKGQATRQVLEKRLDAPWDEISAELQDLMAEGIADTEGAGPGTHYFLTAPEGEDA